MTVPVAIYLLLAVIAACIAAGGCGKAPKEITRPMRVMAYIFLFFFCVWVGLFWPLVLGFRIGRRLS